MRDHQNNLETGDNLDINQKDSLDGKKRFLFKQNKDIESDVQTK